MMRVLVTGGFGYVGGRLVQSLAGDASFAVTAAGRQRRVTPPNVASAVVDWSDAASVGALCKNQDAVVHLAAMNEQESERHPEAALRSNGLATLALLKAAEASGARRFIYMSTYKVFGANPSGVIDEQSVPRPANHYTITHRLSEDYLLAARDKHQLESVVFRLTNSVGVPASPDIDGWMVIGNDLCRQAATSRKIVLKSSGLAWRNFIPMADVVAAIRHVLTIPSASLGDGLFHLGGLRPLRILDLAQLVKARAEKLLGQSVALEHVAALPDERHGILEWRIEKLMATGWKSTADFDVEIDATLRMCRDAFVCRS